MGVIYSLNEQWCVCQSISASQHEPRVPASPGDTTLALGWHLQMGDPGNLPAGTEVTAKKDKSGQERMERSS